MKSLARHVLTASLALLMVAGSALTDPAPDPNLAFVHLHSPRLACLGTRVAPAGCVQLSEGYFMDEPTYNKLDAEVKRLQEAEVRLQAENGSLKQSVSGWQPGFYTLAIAVVSSIALAVYVDRKF